MIQAQIDSWFAQFDTNEDGQLQREEVAALRQQEGAPAQASKL